MITTNSSIEDKKLLGLILPWKPPFVYKMHLASHRSLHCQVSKLQQGGSSDQELQKQRTNHGKHLLSISITSCPGREKGNYKKSSAHKTNNGSLKKFKKRSPEDLKPREQDTRRTSGNTTRNDPFPPFLIIEAQTQESRDYGLRVSLESREKNDVIERIYSAPSCSEPDMWLMWTAVNDVIFEIVELRSMFEKQDEVEKFDLIQPFHACKQEEGKPVADYVLKMKGYMEKLERLGYVLPQDITGDYSNERMRRVYLKRLKTPQVMIIKDGKIEKANKKRLMQRQYKVKGKGKDKRFIPKLKNPKLYYELQLRMMPATTVILSIAAFLRYEDMANECQNNFLTGYLDEDIYLEQLKESEYIAASEAAMEAIWIRKFISRLGIVPTINEPLNMYCDNSAAIHYANEPGVQKGARHYHRRYHYVRECVELGEIRILMVSTITI
ncbi:hypothetical protein Tco_0540775 [Tanacetum coccineum]